ncbi:hypothetical protein SARC_09881, partial [Sphaeroforma arctica JP610]
PFLSSFILILSTAPFVPAQSFDFHTQYITPLFSIQHACLVYYTLVSEQVASLTLQLAWQPHNLSLSSVSLWYVEQNEPNLHLRDSYIGSITRLMNALACIHEYLCNYLDIATSVCDVTAHHARLHVLYSTIGCNFMMLTV